jgi:hypothetical protein
LSDFISTSAQIKDPCKTTAILGIAKAASVEKFSVLDNPPGHLCLPVVYFLLFKVGITGVLSTSVLFLCLGIGLGWSTTVWRYIVRLAPYHRGDCEARGGFISTCVYFHFLYFLGKVKVILLFSTRGNKPIGLYPLFKG